MTIRRWILRTLTACLAFTIARTAPAAEPVTDPVSVGWDGGWVVYRYTDADGRWSNWKSPDSPLPRKAFTAVGPDAVAIIDPRAGYGGWHFDLHTQKWTPIPISPISGPTGVLDPIPTAFVGRHLVVWGMTKAQPHGAVLDTQTMKWKPIAEAPVPMRFRAATAVVGQKLLVWGGYGPPDANNAVGRFGPLRNGAVYDVAKDAWEAIPDAPEPAPTYGYAWTTWNDRLVIFGGTANKVQQRTGMTYDPAAKSWDTIPESPFQVGRNAACTATKDRLFVWSGKIVDPNAAGGKGDRLSLDAASYDFATRQWQKLPNAPAPPRSLASARGRGKEVTVWGGWDGATTPPKFFRDGATYDFETSTWRTIPPLPADVPDAVHPGW